MDYAKGKQGGRGGRIRLLSCIGVDLELALLPHFLDHYLSLGIAPERIHLLLNSAEAASPNFEAADRILAARGVAPAARWIAPYTSEAMWRERRALQERVAQAGDWIVNADADELHRYPAPLDEVAAYLRAGRFGAVQGVMIDRLSTDGTLPAVRDDMPLPAQFPVRADVSLSVIGIGTTHGVAGTIKLMMHRHDVFPNRGGHTAIGPERRTRYAAGARLSVIPHVSDPRWRADFPFQVDHYKWTATLRGSLARRLATKGVSVAGREYGGKIDRYLARHGTVRHEDATILAPEVPPVTDWQGILKWLRRGAFYWKVRNAVQLKVSGLRLRLRQAVSP